MVWELAFAAGLLVLFFALYLINWVLKQPSGSSKMREIANAIQEGAQAYLLRQYKTLVLFVILLFLLIGWFAGWNTAIAFLAGVLTSALAGYI